MEKVGAEERTERLMKAMNFNEADLADNKEGRLTPAQQDYLRRIGAEMSRTILRNVVTSVIVGAVLILVLAGGILTNIGGEPPAPEDMAALVPVAGLLSLAIIIPIAYQVIRLVVVSRRLSEGRSPIRRIRGRVRRANLKYQALSSIPTLVAPDGSPRDNRIYVGWRQQRFYVTGSAYNAFQDGQKYIFYTADADPRPIILTAEGID